MPQSVLHIVPRLPPAVDGLGDYALQLASALKHHDGLASAFLVGDPAWTGEPPGFPVTTVAARSPQALLQALPRNPEIAVLLHYVNYGYAQRGCPFWLITGLEQWKYQNPQARLITQFHEVYVYAPGPPWTSSFWLAPLQRQLAARLSCFSDRCLTNRQYYAQLIHQLTRGQHSQIPVLPVFSNVGEPTSLSLLADRPRHLVVFGSQENRRRVYEQGQDTLNQVCTALQISQIWDIGSPMESRLDQVCSVPIVATGNLSALNISRILQQSIAGFVPYPIAELGKSSIFAAYAAHRLLPIGLPSNQVNQDGLEGGRHCWLANHPSQALTLELAQKIADHAYTWYQPHSLYEHAKVLVTFLYNDNPAASNSGPPPGLES